MPFIIRTALGLRRNRTALAALLVACLGGAAVVYNQSHAGFQTLRVGYNFYPPYIVPRAGAPPDGLAAEMITRAAARAGFRITWVSIGKETAEDALGRGFIEMFPLLTVTDERKRRFHMSQPWWENDMALISLENRKLASADSTGGRRIALRGMPVAQRRAEILFARAHLVTMPQMERMVPALCSGLVDGVFLDLRLLESQLLQGGGCPGLALHVASLPNGSLSLATASTRAVARSSDRIFEQIARLSGDGTLSELASRWSMYNPYDGRHMRDLLDAQHHADLMRYGLAVMTLAVVLISLQTQRIRRARASAEAARLEAEESRQRFDAFMRYTPALTYIKDPESRLLYINDAFCKQFHTSLAAFEGKTGSELWPEEVMQQIRRNDLKVLSSNRSQEMTESLFLPSGELRHFLSLKFPFENRQGQTFLGGVSLDITERKRAEEALRFSQFSIDHSPDTVLWLDAVGHIFYANHAASQNLGYDVDELIGLPIHTLDPAWTFERFAKTRQELKARRSMSVESTHVTRDGRSYPVEISINYLEFNGGEFTCCMARDITERKLAERELSYQALHDQLTGLPNRRLLETRLGEELERARNRNTRLAVLYIDLDGFKLVNDTLGHVVGDALLKQVASRLRGCVGEPCTLARMGGDEFTLILNGLLDDNDAQAVAQNLLASLQEGFVIDGHDLLVTASAGISVFPRDGGDVTGLLQSSDAAMYEAKRLGKNLARFFTPEMGDSARERLEIENHLRRALDRNELALNFQPQVALDSGDVVRYEALLRWDHPLLGSVPPCKFISIAEDTNLIVPIGTWVLEEACRHARAWIETSHEEIGVGVNVSVVQFLRADFVDTLIDVLDRTGLPPYLLELEITETVALQGVEEAADKISRIRDLGVSVSIDDFGTGYSSLSYLQRLPIDILKIDRSFVRDIHMDPSAMAVTAALVSLAHGLGMKVVIEGIETRLQLDAVRKIGCDIAQGYLLGLPVPIESVLCGQAMTAA